MKKHILKLFSAIPALLIAAGLAIFSPSGAEAADTYYFYRECLGSMENGSSLVSAYDILADCMAAAQSQADIRSCGLSESETRLVFNAVYNDHPEFFWLDGSYGYSYSSQGIVISVSPGYHDIDGGLDNAKAAFEDAAGRILAGLRPSMSEFDKEKYIHDALATSIIYDLNAQYDQSAYSALVGGRSVCAGYTKAFLCLLQRAGIRAFAVTGLTDNGDSVTENHAWTYVRIDGEYYQTDLTKDDPISESGSLDLSDVSSVCYSYFNVDDLTMDRDHLIYMLYDSESGYCIEDPDMAVYYDYLPKCSSTAAGYPAMSGSYYVTDGGASAITCDDVIRILTKPTDDACRIFFENPDAENVNSVISRIGELLGDALTRIGSYVGGRIGYSISGRELIYSFTTNKATELHGNINYPYDSSDVFTVSIIGSDNAAVWSGQISGIGASYIAYNLPSGTYSVETYLDGELVGSQQIDVQGQRMECDLIHNVHAYGSDGLCGLCGKKSVAPFVTMQAAVSDVVEVSFELSPEAADLTAYSQYERIALDVTVGDGESVTITGVPSDDGASWRFDYSEIYAKYMADELKGTFRGVKDGGKTDLRHFDGISVSSYCALVAAANPDDTELLTLMANMLRYGAACQLYSGYNTDTPADAPAFVSTNASTAQIPRRELVSSFDHTDASGRIRSATLRITDRISLMFAFSAADVSGMTVTVTPAGRTGESIALSDAPKRTDGTYVITLEKLLPQDYGTVYTVSLMHGGQLIHEVEYSVYAYLYRKQSQTGPLSALVQAIYDYSMAAAAYIS
ncbi:MAG: hypothetical protein IJS22_06365 [Lachnospiraceae bacterium]|nr:hypothetical protein [Lachnospiraceae bacterium]